MRNRITLLVVAVALALTALFAGPATADSGNWRCHSHTYLATGGPVIEYGGNPTTEFHRWIFDLYPYRVVEVWFQTRPGGPIYYFQQYWTQCF